MEVVSACSLPVSSVLWQPRPSAWVLTVVCKATFELLPVESPLAAVQVPLTELDAYWDDDQRRSLYAASDLVPVKPRADVTLVGHAFAPRGQPALSLVARLVVGELDKSVEVCADRVFHADGSLHEGARFSRMPLVYERAAGGPDSWNPVGRRSDARDAYGRTILPNLQPPGSHVSALGDFVEPIGFGPIAPTWPWRREKLGRHAAYWVLNAWRHNPLPTDLELLYFNVAPRDQQLTVLRENERLILENLHPEHARLVTNLSNVQPRATIEGRRDGPRPLTLRCDTLAIDTDNAICTLTWRGQLPLEHADEAGQIEIAMTSREGSSARDLATMTQAVALGAIAAPLLPFVSVSSADTHRQNDGVRATGGMPFVANPQLSIQSPSQETPAVAPVSSTPIATQHQIAAIMPPAIVREALSGGGAIAGQPQEPLSVWAGGHRPSRDAMANSEMSAIAVRPTMNEDAARAGVAAVSDAAARLEEQALGLGSEEARVRQESASAAIMPKEPVRLVWFDPKYPTRLRKHPDWQLLLAEFDLERLEAKQAEQEQNEEDETPEGKERRDLFAILADGTDLDAAGLDRSFSEAIDERGRFVPPLVLVAGDLALPFDELESLKATMTMASPAALGDKKLKEVLDAVSEVLKVPGFSSETGLADGLQRQVEEAFAPVGQRQRLAPDWLSVHRTRMLLTGRHYQRRTLRGKKWLRGVMRLLRGGTLTTYVPDELASELPMFACVPARVIGEMEGPHELGEVGRWVVFVGALGVRVRRS